MPNHIKTILKVQTEDIEKMKEIADRISGENGAIDFNALVQMPEEIRNNTSPSRFVTEEEYPKIHAQELKDVSDPKKYVTFSITEKMHNELVEKYGASNWYEWSLENWGTKWNAYDISYSEEGFCYEFETAWSHPFPIIEKLSLLFPDIEFFVQYADEDMGSNCGEYAIRNGEKLSEWQGHYYENRVEALKFAYDVWGYSYDDDYDEEGNRKDEEE